MTGWVAKRFWKEVAVEAEGKGFCVLLDARPVMSPAKAPLILPTRMMAEAMADEWRSVEGVIDPTDMPVTRAANSAIDKVAPQFAEVVRIIAEYGGTDLLCYRAEAPQELCDEQAEAWDPMLDWAASDLNAPLRATRGVVPVDQPPDSLERLFNEVCRTTPFQLAALHDLVALTGSLILGLAATRPEFQPEELWRMSRIDEVWQARLWGVDEEAAAAAALKRTGFFAAHNFWRLASAE
ncbi:hypothetical protein DEA8626_00039 [Defluviimonas aquaemixtae]|uniref:ATPase n=1 Tax=Albidovulum aquaemixtae TaxID=1542388 RepID=A0A2R8B1W1_9RHOB|nr:ATP12 family protein [Defluviimonas aquaemixtae]SPH16530.1 hypothetical protein DEA8626_00039 [Defluviimonas aquaemixtae]